MRLTELSLQDFRSYQSETWEFEQDRIVFCGPNGRGKTNVLEAISLLSIGKSWRETSAQDLISDKCDPMFQSAKITGKNQALDQFQTLIQPRSRRFFKNEKKLSRQEYFGQIPTILFCPEFINLFSGGKANRVQFFDRFLIQISKPYRTNLLKATKAHKHKTKLLKQTDLFSSYLDEQIRVWNEVLIECMPVLYEEKVKFLEVLQPLFETELQKISQKAETVHLSICSAENILLEPVPLRNFFEASTEREKAAQKNLIAPHRDDWNFSYRDKPLSSSASRGEERSILLALLSAQKQYLFQITKQAPILLLDDVFSELDADRQGHLDHLCEDGQVFFTTTHTEHFERFKGKVQVFRM